MERGWKARQRDARVPSWPRLGARASAHLAGRAAVDAEVRVARVVHNIKVAGAQVAGARAQRLGAVAVRAGQDAGAAAAAALAHKKGVVNVFDLAHHNGKRRNLRAASGQAPQQ